MQAYFNFCLSPQIPYLIARYAPAAPLLCVLETPRRKAARSSVESMVKTDDGHVAVEGHTFQRDPSGIATHGNKVFTGYMHFRKSPHKLVHCPNLAHQRKISRTCKNQDVALQSVSRFATWQLARCQQGPNTTTALDNRGAMQKQWTICCHKRLHQSHKPT